MAFIDARMNDVVAYGFEGGPEYLTNEVMLENGLRYADSARMYPTHKYNAQLDNLDDDRLKVVLNMIHACRGKLHNFMFKDWNDYQAENEPLVMPDDYVGTKKELQLYVVYNFAPAYTVRPIQALESAVIYKGGVAIPGVLDKTRGTFVPTDNWAAGNDYTWSGEFYVWTHFTDDYVPATINSWRATTVNIDLMEERRRITATNVPLSWDA